MNKEFRVAEVFGPTIQGEGRLVGMPCHFVRFGGCDFRCSWCDSPHAVLPDLVAKLPKMDAWKILGKVSNLDREDNAYIRWVVLTGGNPGLLDLDHLIDLFHERKYSVMLETQGSVFRPWFAKVDDLCFSPKPPSAGNTTMVGGLSRILYALETEQGLEGGRKPYLKVPIFDEGDLVYAEKIHMAFPNLEFFLSIGNMDPSLPTVANPYPHVWEHPAVTTTDHLLARYAEVVHWVLTKYPGLQDARIFPQQHALLWGNARGH